MIIKSNGNSLGKYSKYPVKNLNKRWKNHHFQYIDVVYIVIALLKERDRQMDTALSKKKVKKELIIL